MLSLLRANWKRVVATTVWTLVVLNVVFFIQRAMMADQCDVDALIQKVKLRHRICVYDAAAILWA